MYFLRNFGNNPWPKFLIKKEYITIAGNSSILVLHYKLFLQEMLLPANGCLCDSENEAFLDYPENEILYRLNRKTSEPHSRCCFVVLASCKLKDIEFNWGSLVLSKF